MEEVHEIRIAATEKLEDDIVTAITRAQTLAARGGLTFKWTTSQLRMRRAVGGNRQGGSSDGSTQHKSAPSGEELEGQSQGPELSEAQTTKSSTSKAASQEPMRRQW